MYYLISFSQKLSYIDETETIFFSLPHSRYWGLEVLGHVNSVVKSRVLLSRSISVLLSIAPFEKGILELGPLTMAPWEQKRVACRDLYSHSTKEGSQTNIFWNVLHFRQKPKQSGWRATHICCEAWEFLLHFRGNTCLCHCEESQSTGSLEL